MEFVCFPSFGNFYKICSAHSFSAGSLHSENKQRPPEYEKFFEEPQIKEVLEVSSDPLANSAANNVFEFTSSRFSVRWLK